MKDSEKWQAGKFVYRKGKLVASRNLEEVGLASRLIAGIVAARYDTNLRKHARGRLLDLGCGKVPLYEAYKDLVTDNVCVDWPNCLHENRHVDHKCDLNQELHFESGEFDTIILSDVLEHIREPALLWSEMSRVLSEGGKILMNVPFYYWLHEQPHDYYRYTEFALQRFVEMSGLRLVVLEPIGGAPEVVVDVFFQDYPRHTYTRTTARGPGPAGLYGVPQDATREPSFLSNQQDVPSRVFSGRREGEDLGHCCELGSRWSAGCKIRSMVAISTNSWAAYQGRTPEAHPLYQVMSQRPETFFAHGHCRAPSPQEERYRRRHRLIWEVACRSRAHVASRSRSSRNPIATRLNGNASNAIAKCPDMARTLVPSGTRSPST